MTAGFEGVENHAVAVLSPTTLAVKASAFLIGERMAMTAAHATGKLGTFQPLKCGTKIVIGVVTKRSELVDLAVVEFDESCGAVVTKLADRDVKVGAPIGILGWPGGRFLMFTRGVASSYESVHTQFGARFSLLSDVAIFFGNSGGAVFDEQQRVVGVAVGRLCFDDDDQPGQCYASVVPVSLVKLFLFAKV